MEYGGCPGFGTGQIRTGVKRFRAAFIGGDGGRAIIRMEHQVERAADERSVLVAEMPRGISSKQSRKTQDYQDSLKNFPHGLH